MQIEPIQENHWSEIMAVQSAVYHEIEPEDLAVMSRKWELAPEFCWVVIADGRVKGYVLAHPWINDHIPPLHSRLASLPLHADSVFVHDLALMPELRGRGSAVALFERMKAGALERGYGRSHLTAIQGSAMFWRKMGYQEDSFPLPSSYPQGACLMRQCWLG